jgi:hypothetical protein
MQKSTGRSSDAAGFAPEENVHWRWNAPILSMRGILYCVDEVAQSLDAFSDARNWIDGLNKEGDARQSRMQAVGKCQILETADRDLDRGFGGTFDNPDDFLRVAGHPRRWSFGRHANVVEGAKPIGHKLALRLDLSVETQPIKPVGHLRKTFVHQWIAACHDHQHRLLRTLFDLVDDLGRSDPLPSCGPRRVHRMRAVAPRATITAAACAKNIAGWPM